MADGRKLILSPEDSRPYYNKKEWVEEFLDSEGAFDNR